MRTKLFKALSEELCSFIEQEGMAVRPYSHPGLSYFQQLTEEGQQTAIETLQNYLEVCRSVYKENHSLKDSAFLVQKGLEYFSYQCHPSIFEMVEKESRVVEFYTPQNTQIFRTINYFEFASYTIEDLYCRPWNHLYIRDEEIDNLLIQGVGAVLTKAVGPEGVLVPNQHLLTEKASLERVTITVDGVHLLPLMQKEAVEGFACIIDCRPLLY